MKEVIQKYNNFTFSGLRNSFRARNPPMNNLFGW
jgi:hypothetical protein